MISQVNVNSVYPSDGKCLNEFNEWHDTEVKISKYYAVSIPIDANLDQPLVFTSKIEALAAIKKYSGARFKEFTSYEKAVEYGSKILPDFQTQTTCSKEKSLFKSLTSQEKMSFRKTIETDDEVAFLDKVWSNPCYLINNAGDGPTILQEGCRYNALHVAAKYKTTKVCLSILNTLYNVEFISKLYPDENLQKTKERIKRLVDLYLNTPDKTLSETPLHFACKYGANEILSVLLSLPECDINKRNKFGLLAREMVCDRALDCLHLKEDMLLMFEGLFYVPVLRDIANNIQEPVIGKPCRSNIVLEVTSHSLPSYLIHPSNSFVYCAFAGPMSQNAADKFYRVFSKKKFSEQMSCTPEQKKLLVDICLSDSKKGLERVGRTLAKEFGTGWIEFWPQLKFWGDLSSAFGLEFLDNHLKSQYKILNTSCSSLNSEDKCDSFAGLILAFVDEFVRKLPQLLSCKNKMSFFILFQNLLLYTLCMSTDSFSEEDQLFHIHHEIGQLLYLKLIKFNKEDFEAIKFYINIQFIYIYNFLHGLPSVCEKWRMFLCILKYAFYYQSSNVLASNPQVCKCSWTIKKECYTYKSSLCYYSVVKLRQNFAKLDISSLQKEKASAPASINISDKKEVVNLEDYQINQEKDMLLSDTFKILSLTCSEEEESEEYFTPPQSPTHDAIEIFVNGKDFTDVDIDILRAVIDRGANVYRTDHPYVFSWKYLVESKLGFLLKPEDKLSCTPSSSSASVRRAIMPKEKVRRTLF